MWHREFRDYKTDEANIKEPIQSGKGIIGCQMHEISGWGNTLHRPIKKKKGAIASLVSYFLGSEGDAK